MRSHLICVRAVRPKALRCRTSEKNFQLACARMDELTLLLGMKKRTDKATETVVNLAIELKNFKGELLAARFLDRLKIPLEISLRVLSRTASQLRKKD